MQNLNVERIVDSLYCTVGINIWKCLDWQWCWTVSRVHLHPCPFLLIDTQARCSRYNIMWSSLSVTCGRSVVSPGISVSSTNKIDRHEITEILLKVASNTITLTLTLLIDQLLILFSTVYILMFVFYIGQQTCLILLHKERFLASNNIYIIM